MEMWAHYFIDYATGIALLTFRVVSSFAFLEKINFIQDSYSDKMFVLK